MSYLPDRIEQLLPSFIPVAQKLLERLAVLNYKPVPKDTTRSPAEAAAHAAQGTGIADSMHCYGAAMDVICNDHGWSCHAKGCHFFEVLGEEAERLGLVWGGRWLRRDFPHVQCITVVEQRMMRQAKTVDERDAIAKHSLASRAR